MAPRTILYTGKGWSREDEHRRRDRAPLRRGGAPHRGAVHRSRAQPVRLARAELWPQPTHVGANLFGQVQAQEEMERHWDGVQTSRSSSSARGGLYRRTTALNERDCPAQGPDKVP